MSLLAIDNKFANTRAISIKELLSQIQTLKVPRFQRNYDWDKEKVGALWNDVMENFDLVRDNPDPVPEAQYLLGPVVLVKSGTEKTLFVIDGQQRLSTLTMLFCVARDIMREYGVSDGISKLENLLSNKHMGRHTNWKLELNDTDKELFSEIQKYEPDEQQSQKQRLESRKYKTKSEKLLAGNYRFLYDRVLEFLDERQNHEGSHSEQASTDENTREALRKENIPMLSYFIDFVCEYNYVVMVMVNDDSTAFQIFETLNERGKTLSKSNLIKNHILNQVKESYTQKEQSDRWNRIFDKVVGNNQQDDDFIMESYNSRYADAGSLRSRHESEFHMSKKNLYKIIKGLVSDKDSCKQLIDELETDAEFLSKLNDPSQYDVDEESKDDIHAIRALKAKFIRVPILAAYRKWYDERQDEYSKLVRFLTKFFFKIRVVRQEHPGNIEKISNDAVMMINKGESFGAVIAKLKEYDNHDYFKSDFKKRFMPKPANDAAKYALQQITIHLGTPDNDVKPIENLTLEHIFPKAHDKWDLEDFSQGRDINKNDIEEFKTRLGNLTLLTKSLNAKLRDLPFPMKKEYNDPKTDAAMGYIVSNLEINQQTVCNHDEWNVKVIEDREEEFAGYADEIWRLD